MAVSRHDRKLTYEEWLDFPAVEGNRTELIDGEVGLAPEATLRHQTIVLRLAFAFETYLRAHAVGRIFITPNVRLAPDQGYAPDMIFVHDPGNDPLSYHGPPPLVVEVVSDERRDLRLKRDRYERYGVPEYWAVLPDAEQVQAFRLEQSRYEVTVFEAPGIISPLILPDLRIDLRALFAE